ncbi:MAG: lamin tail domain-containing protein, partial [Prolixibacteraceae bacterium]|nr:lamin tail domain-containing protein [Prolixibacteraceae bacterium]
ILAGSDNGKPVDLGAKLPRVSLEPDVLISQVYINPLNTLNPEFVALYNPSAKTIDLSGYSFTSGISDTIPAGTILEPGDTLYVVSDMLNWVRKVKQIVWEEGKLSNEGEGVELRNSFGMVADFIRYSSETGWPAQAFNADVVMNLKSSKLDNHFGENWEALSLWQITSVKQETKADIVVYPNPATERINVLISGQPNQSVQLFSSLGLLIYQSKTNAIGEAFFDVSALNEGIYLVKAGSKTAKVMVVWSR